VPRISTDVLEEDGPNMIFMQGINADELGYQGLPKKVEIIRDDGFRIEHIISVAL
jgi:hypothetical protein